MRGELRIRKLLKNLNSSAFVVERGRRAGDGQPGGLRLPRAPAGATASACARPGPSAGRSAGQGYRQILRHYFNGAELTQIY